MTIIIDGYNFIKYITGTSYVSESDIGDWIRLFQSYVALRNNQVIIVFDAGPGYYMSREIHGSIIVLYSGQEQSADDVIKEWLEYNKDKDLLLVTSDREICDFATRLDVVSIGSGDFYNIFNHVMGQESERELQITGTLYKTSDDSTSELDKLMDLGSRGLVSSVFKEEKLPIRARGGKKASKQSKKLTRKIEKI